MVLHLKNGFLRRIVAILRKIDSSVLYTPDKNFSWACSLFVRPKYYSTTRIYRFRSRISIPLWKSSFQRFYKECQCRYTGYPRVCSSAYFGTHPYLSAEAIIWMGWPVNWLSRSLCSRFCCRSRRICAYLWRSYEIREGQSSLCTSIEGLEQLIKELS
jgi:hypothetical protein